MIYKLGKKPARVDERTIQLARLLVPANLPSLPASYNTFDNLGIVDNNTFNNTKYGDCVIAARAHMTLAFEKFEQGTLPPIADEDVASEYFLETGGPDTGLNMLDSLKKWRQDGWMAAGKRYYIDAFVGVDWKNHDQVKYCIYLFGGIYFGLALPLSAQAQYENGQIWDIVTGPDAAPGSWGLHALYGLAYGPPSKAAIVGYSEVGPVCITWGKFQQMTWAFWDKYVDEAYGVIDSLDDWVNPANDPLNVPLLRSTLEEITGKPLPPPQPAPPNPPSPPPAPQVLTMSLPAGRVNVAYTARLRAQGGSPPYTWSISQGNLIGAPLPTGLSLSPAGLISGVPTIDGETYLVFQVTDTTRASSGVALTITIKPPACSVLKWLAGRKRL